MAEASTELMVGVLAAGVGVLLAAYGVWYVRANNLRDMRGQALPSPRALVPVMMHVFYIVQGRLRCCISETIHDLLMRWGGAMHFVVLRLPFLSPKLAILGDPTLARTVLAGKHTAFPKPPTYDRSKFLFGEGLITSNGALWQAHRRLLSPSFHAEHLRHMVATMAKHATEFADLLRQQMQSGMAPSPVDADVFGLLCGLTLDVIGETGFGVDLNAKTGGSPLAGAAKGLLDEVNRRIIDVSPLQTQWRQEETDRHLSVIHELMDKAVSERMADRKKENHELKEDGYQPRDLLDIVLDAAEEQRQEAADGERAGDAADEQGAEERHGGSSRSETAMTPALMRDHIVTFVGAGHETVSTTLSWTLFDLCMHPEVQARLQAEADRVFEQSQGGGQQLTNDDLAGLQFTYQVIQESMRLHPPVGLVARSFAEDTTFHFTPTEAVAARGVKPFEFSLDRKYSCIVSISELHRHPDYWASPNEFVPDRWELSYEKLPGNEDGKTRRHPFQYAPFSAGPRNCIGQAFARKEACIILATIMRHFSVQFAPGCHAGMVRAYETITIRPDKFRARFSLRTEERE